jgi:hypothetical protein
MTTNQPAEKLATELESAAEKLAAVKLASDERREKREFIRSLVLGLLVSLPGIIAACIGAANNAQGKQTHDLVNSRMSELLEKVETASRAEGVLEGRASKAP